MAVAAGASVTMSPVSAGNISDGVKATDPSGLSGNQRVAGSVGVALAPDLILESPTVSDRCPKVDTTFTLASTVRNQGSGPSLATTLRYYRSADATITPSDTKVARDLRQGFLKVRFVYAA